VVITSPSCLSAVLSAAPDAAELRDALARVVRVVLGPTTAAALERAGLAPALAARAPTPLAVATVLEAALAR